MGFCKRCVQCSDINVHEMKYHLTQTHLVSEIIQVSTHRFLQRQPHFIFEVLESHFRKTTTLNAAARGTLLPTLAMISGTNEAGIRQLIQNSFGNFDFQYANPENDLARREMRHQISGYYYEQDAMTLWAGLITLYNGIVDNNYLTDDAVASDVPLKCWSSYIRNVGNVNGFPAEIQTKRQLAEVLSTIVFIVSVQHSAVNYSQSYYFGCVRNAPGAIYYDLESIDTLDVPNDPFQVKEWLADLQGRFVELLSGPPNDGETLTNIVTNYPPMYNPFKHQFLEVLTNLNNSFQERNRVFPILVPGFIPCTLAGGIFK